MMRDAIRPLALLILLPALADAQEPIPPPSPTPEAALGFRMGADNKLAKWGQVVDYIRLLDRFNDRVSIEEMGSSTQGRPMIAAIVSSEETIKNLGRYKALQRRLALPDEPSPGAAEGLDPVEESKTVVLVTCTIHSSETASTLMALELLHGLATADDPATKEILENTILVLVPSVNPDGVDIVADWYERSLGKPWEGSGLPRLYHPYAGHDTNRDWFMLNLKETQNLTRLLYQEWFPTITWDVHQMGSTGPRLFVPPFFDPINPNLDPRINQGIRLIGSHLAAGLAAEGKKGVATQVMYDNWWNGGNRTVPQRHNMVGILTEAASVRLASPIFLEPGDLKGGGRGFPDHKPSVDFVDPWPGGWWRLRDIVDYELTCARSLLTLAARYRVWFQKNYTEMAADAIGKGRGEPPYGWVVPVGQRDPGTAAEMVRILADTGIRAYRANEAFEAGGVKVEAGSWLLPADQPYRAHLKDMMERQVYPERVGADGTPERPYDVAGWTLPLQMGVEAIEVARPLGGAVETLPVERVAVPALPARPIPGPEKPAGYVLPMTTLADHTFLNRALAAGVEPGLLGGPAKYDGGVELDAGAAWLPATDKVRDLYRAAFDQPRFRPALAGVSGMGGLEGSEPLALMRHGPRVGVYQPWQPSMDEGWTRLVLEQYEFPYTTLHNAHIRLGRLREKYDTIVLPSVGNSTLTNGFRPGQTEPDYVGGLGDEGLDALKAFVQEGGTLVCLEASCGYAIDGFDLPVENALRGLRAADFYCPGSILRIEFPREGRSSGLSAGLPDQGAAYFAGSLAFEVEEEAEGVQVVARYAGRDVLLSGWLLGEEHLAGKAAVVSVRVGTGRVVLFGFPPQHRGQPRGTFGLFFQALRPAPRGADEGTGGDREASKRQGLPPRAATPADVVH